VDRLSGVKPLSQAERRAIQTYLAASYGLDDVVTRTARLLAQLTRQVAVVQYPSLTRSAVRHIELVRLAPEKLLVVLITDTGRVEQRTVDLPDPCEDDDVAHLRAVLNASLDGRRLTEAVEIVAGLTDRVPPAGRRNADAVFSIIMENLVERNEEKIVFGGTANLAAPDFSQGLREVLEALEEQVVLMRLLGEASDQSLLTVLIGTENPVEGLRTTSLVSSGYGSGGETLAKLAVLGPTRMDYPGTMGAVSTVARYVGKILMET
jgi:heat-inducible transcriptional repressor